MKKDIRCSACGRRRKPSHEKRCQTNPYNKDCLTYEEWCKKNPNRKQERSEAKKKIREEKEVIRKAILDKWIREKREQEARDEEARVKREQEQKEKNK